MLGFSATKPPTSTMTRLQLSLAIGDYDRTRPLLDGGVQIDGVAPIVMALGPEEIFFRAFRHAEFDICELSLSSFAVMVAAGECPYVGVPAFVSRAFRHTSIYEHRAILRTAKSALPSTSSLQTFGPVPCWQRIMACCHMIRSGCAADWKNPADPRRSQ
jgi:hypothetical protein